MILRKLWRELENMKKIYKILTIASLFIGIALGLLFKEFSIAIDTIGEHYIYALKILIGPVIFMALAVSILNHKKGDSKLIFKTVGLFILMFVLTFLLTSLIVSLLSPGTGFTVDSTELPNKQADFNILHILLSLLPISNGSFDILGLLLGKYIFFIIVLATLISIIFCNKYTKETYSKVVSFIKKILNIALKGVLYITPIGIISLVAKTVATSGSLLIDVGIKYILIAYLCSIVTILLIMILPVWIIAKINPLEYIKKVAKVWLITLTTTSSVATLPYTIKTCNEDFNIDEKITNIVVPLGCTIHMCGGAVSFSLLGLFVAQMYGITVTLPLFGLMILSSTLINMAAPGIPGGGKIIGFTYLSLLGLPITGFYGLYVGIYSILDMAYTTLNVTGDISANIIINKLNKN